MLLSFSYISIKKVSYLLLACLVSHLMCLCKALKEKSSHVKTDFLSTPGGSDSRESIYNAGDPSLIPGSGRSPGEGNNNPLQYSCLENPMDGGAL